MNILLKNHSGQPTVSVIVPNYNHARFLDQRMQTIFDQTWRDFEVIFLDDASTDNSLEIFEKYRKNPHVSKIIVNNTNSGSPFIQWNRGIREARGKYIWIAESDDYSAPEFLETMIKKLEANSTAGLAYCQSWVVSKAGQRPSVQRLSMNDRVRWSNDFFSPGLIELSRYPYYAGKILNASSVVCRSDCWNQIGLADESMSQSADWLCWAKFLLISDVCYSAERLNYYRVHDGNVTQKNRLTGKMILEDYKVINYISSIREIRWARRWAFVFRSHFVQSYKLLELGWKNGLKIYFSKHSSLNLALITNTKDRCVVIRMIILLPVFVFRSMLLKLQSLRSDKKLLES
ncbi:MAG: glycosyltransferase family 2 protein [Patescibacteria group bacterium]